MTFFRKYVLPKCKKLTTLKIIARVNYFFFLKPKYLFVLTFYYKSLKESFCFIRNDTLVIFVFRLKKIYLILQNEAIRNKLPFVLKN